jgi:hypothetical protein
MINKKEGARFLKFEWKKFILPLILIILFAYQTYVFYSIGSLMDKSICQITNIQETARNYIKQNNTEMLDELTIERGLKMKELQEDINNAMGIKAIFYITTAIDPFFPVSCEITFKNYCRHYVSQETYNCAYNFATDLSSLLERPEYKPVSSWLLILHFILFFILGYFISAVILWVFRNVKIKK